MNASSDDRSGPRAVQTPQAVVLADRVAQRQVVAACCPKACAAGVRAGMTLAHARALLPPASTHIEDHDPRRDQAALRKLAVWAHRFSPLVAPDPPDGLLLDISGCERAFRGERRLVRQLLSGVDRLGITAQAAVAPTYGAAWALARHSEHRNPIISRSDLREAIASLPVEGLRIAPVVALALDELGIETIGQVIDLPRASLPSRFGDELLHRLGQATGDVMELIEPVRHVPMPRAERAFDGATTRIEAIEAGVRDLLDELTGQLAERQAGARALVIELGRMDSVPTRITVQLSRPCADARHLWTLARPRLERASLGYGVERLAVAAPHIGRIRHRQAEQWRHDAKDDAADSPEMAALVDVLSNRLGAENVMRVEVRPTHQPERVFGYVPAIEGMLAMPDCPGALTTSDRPTLLLSPPEAASVLAMVPDLPPSRVGWRGREHVIIAGFGPERVEAEWWRTRGSARDYYRVEDAGGLWLWLYREVETAKWFVHGVWA